jgi:hypothetical protein
MVAQLHGACRSDDSVARRIFALVPRWIACTSWQRPVGNHFGPNLATRPHAGMRAPNHRVDKTRCPAKDRASVDFLREQGRDQRRADGRRTPGDDAALSKIKVHGGRMSAKDMVEVEE